jgi:hypothetical protein
VYIELSKFPPRLATVSRQASAQGLKSPLVWLLEWLLSQLLLVLFILWVGSAQDWAFNQRSPRFEVMIQILSQLIRGNISKTSVATPISESKTHK